LQLAPIADAPAAIDVHALAENAFGADLCTFAHLRLMPYAGARAERSILRDIGRRMDGDALADSHLGQDLAGASTARRMSLPPSLWLTRNSTHNSGASHRPLETSVAIRPARGGSVAKRITLGP